MKKLLKLEFEAARHGDLQHLRSVLTPSNVNSVDGRRGWTVLHYAALYGQMECVKYCLEIHANVNARERQGSTPLHYACHEGLIDVALVLLDAGARVDATALFGLTPLHYAMKTNHRDVAKLLIDRGAILHMLN
jgi:ankyrin repeat protein